jgi:hypothetical protein
MDYAMQNDQHNAGHDDLAELWNRAQHRRAEEIYSWLTHFLERYRQPESSGEASLQSIETASAHEWHRLKPVTNATSGTICLTALR